jgi:hypothetical protein
MIVCPPSAEVRPDPRRPSRRPKPSLGIVVYFQLANITFRSGLPTGGVDAVRPRQDVRGQQG